MAKKAAAPKSSPAKSAPKSAPKGAPKPSGKVDNFAAALGNLEGAWNESRTKEPTSNNFGPADVPDGEYIVQLIGARTGVYKTGSKKGTPYLRFRYNIILGDYTGEVLQSSDDLSTDPVGGKGATKMSLLVERLQRMGVETKKLDLRKLPELCVFLVDTNKNPDAKPHFRVQVVNNFSEGSDGQTRHFQNVYINEVIHPDDVEAMLAG